VWVMVRILLMREVIKAIEIIERVNKKAADKTKTIVSRYRLKTLPDGTRSLKYACTPVF
jgi:hypothetical protein